MTHDRYDSGTRVGMTQGGYCPGLVLPRVGMT